MAFNTNYKDLGLFGVESLGTKSIAPNNDRFKYVKSVRSMGKSNRGNGSPGSNQFVSHNTQSGTGGFTGNGAKFCSMETTNTSWKRSREDRDYLREWRESVAARRTNERITPKSCRLPLRSLPVCCGAEIVAGATAVQ
nr:uncharacterized protein LOC109180610 isoform X2 [Ipomoea batatas]